MYIFIERDLLKLCPFGCAAHYVIKVAPKPSGADVPRLRAGW